MVAAPHLQRCKLIPAAEGTTAGVDLHWVHQKVLRGGRFVCLLRVRNKGRKIVSPSVSYLLTCRSQVWKALQSCGDSFVG